MKKLSYFSLLAILLSLSSCQLVEGIFKAGMTTGIILVVVVIGLIIFILSKVMGGK